MKACKVSKFQVQGCRFSVESPFCSSVVGIQSLGASIGACLVTAIGILVGAMFLVACGKSAETDKLQVVVSILPQAEFVRSVGGEHVAVTVMIPPGASPATYEPTPKQLRELNNAKLYVRIGHIPFEKAWMDKILKANPALEVVDSSKGIELIDNNPHIWNSPRLVKQQVEHIYQGLVEVDPAHQETYAQNKALYLEALDTLDADIRAQFEGIEDRAFMVFHPVWGYFARDYNLEQIPIEEEGKEPSASDITALIDTAKAKGIDAVFVQPQFSERHGQIIAQQIGGELVAVDPLARDYGANLREVAEKFARSMQ